MAALVGEAWPPFLVDVGAHDGQTLSNSRPLLALGWSGVLVEPLPAAFERLDALYRDRPDVHCVQAACADAEGQRQLHLGTDGPLTMNSSLHAQRGRRDAVTVTVRTLTSVLEDCDVPSDFSILLVDAEGADYEVLAGLDFERFRPRVVVTEDDLSAPDRHAAKTRLLGERGYVLYAVVGNSIWITEQVARDALDVADPVPAGPLMDREGALARAPKAALVRRCLELERSRDEIWGELEVVRRSHSWRATRPLRTLVQRVRAIASKLSR